LLKRIAKRIKGYPLINKCQMCKSGIGQWAYEYRSPQYIRDHEPPTLHVCKKCCYRETFGSKIYVKKMKEGVLDG
jgi:hypothetical protein